MSHKTTDITGKDLSYACHYGLLLEHTLYTAAGTIRPEPDHVVLELPGKKPRRFDTMSGAYEVLMRETKKAKEVAA